MSRILSAKFRDICNYWQVENMGYVTAKIDEQKTEATKQKIAKMCNMDYLPQNPAILVSSINMLLRDEEFDSLEYDKD